MEIDKLVNLNTSVSSIETNSLQNTISTVKTQNSPNIVAKKHKKKKLSYKTIMKQNMVSSRSREDEIKQQQYKISKSTGGGNFAKGNFEKL